MCLLLFKVAQIALQIVNLAFSFVRVRVLALFASVSFENLSEIEWGDGLCFDLPNGGARYEMVVAYQTLSTD